MSEPLDIEELRRAIVKSDETLLDVLQHRRHLSKQIAQYKMSLSKPIRDLTREKALLTTLIEKGRQKQIDPYLVTAIFKTIIEDSIRYQESLTHLKQWNDNVSQSLITIAYQGIEASYSHLATLKHFTFFGSKINAQGFQDFSSVIECVNQQQAEFGILPIENTTYGNINEVYDLLLKSQLYVVGEIKYHVNHCLMATQSTSIENIEKIYTHPIAAAQCNRFLKRYPHISIHYWDDTASSAKKLQELNDPSIAAIASEQAALHYDLQTIQRDIADQLKNYTRFIVVARSPINVDKRLHAKTSIVFSSQDKPGALIKALQPFGQFNINLTKIESRPILENPWEEMYYLDFEGNINDKPIEQVIHQLKQHTRFYRLLGCYPAQDFQKPVPIQAAIDDYHHQLLQSGFFQTHQ